jgi:hypothetical protein
VSRSNQWRQSNSCCYLLKGKQRFAAEAARRASFCYKPNKLTKPKKMGRNGFAVTSQSWAKPARGRHTTAFSDDRFRRGEQRLNFSLEPTGRHRRRHRVGIERRGVEQAAGQRVSAARRLRAGSSGRRGRCAAVSREVDSWLTSQGDGAPLSFRHECFLDPHCELFISKAKASITTPPGSVRSRSLGCAPLIAPSTILRHASAVFPNMTMSDPS